VVTSERVLRANAAVFAVVFALVVASGYVPGWITHVGNERMLFGLFMMSELDDITHGVTALACAVAALHSARLVRLVFVTFGSYYALDAVFYLLYGFVNDKTLMQNIMLNLPHVIIGAWMLGLAYRGRRAALVAPRLEASLAH
jgi:hypothetical protein